jgi:hypothetical protein
MASLTEHKGKPTRAVCNRRKHCVYATWMHADLRGSHAPATYLKLQCPHRLKQAAARFRLSNARIRANTDVKLNYRNRTCTRSEGCRKKGLVDNEHHVLFQCTAFQGIRSTYPHLFDTCNRSVYRFMQAAYQVETARDFCKCSYDIESIVNER